MSENISTELRNWFLSLGFQDKNVSSGQIEEEFHRLSPPEMRDIWRSIMTHVVPVKEARYIRKILLLNQLQLLSEKHKKKVKISAKVSSLQEFSKFKTYAETSDKLKRYQKAVADVTEEVQNLKLALLEKEKRYQIVTQQADNQDREDILNELKIVNQEHTIKELNDIHTYLQQVNLSSNVENVNQQSTTDCSDIVKLCLKFTHEYIQRKNELSDEEKMKAKEQLVSNIMKLTSNVSATDLCEAVIKILKDTLGTLLTMSDHVCAKYKTEHIWLFKSKLTELKKQRIHLSLKNKKDKMHLKGLIEYTENKKSEIVSTLKELSKTDSQAENYNTWLQSECLKRRLTIRENFLNKETEEISGRAKELLSLDGEQIKEQLLISAQNYNKQLSILEKEIISRLSDLTDNPIDMFIECQNNCISKIQNFITQNSINRLPELSAANVSGDVQQHQLDENRSLEETSILSSKYELPDDFIVKCAEKGIFLIYLQDAYEKYSQIMGQSTTPSDPLRNLNFTIQKEECEFLNKLRKSLIEMKTNLKEVGNYGEDCAKNMQIWIEESVNDIVPEQMLVGDRSFTEWIKRYAAVFQCLRKMKKMNSVNH